MTEAVRLPVMLPAQQDGWYALMDVHQRLPNDWTLVGGQMVHLHCAERGRLPARPTNDADAVVDVRADPAALERFTAVLYDLGFSPETAGSGAQHRWMRGTAQIDVLVPEGIGRVGARPGAGGGPSVEAPGTTQALARSEAVRVELGGRVGTVRRPNLLGALVVKAAARTEVPANRAAVRHCEDFVVLATLVGARDLRTEVTRRDRKRLRDMIARCRQDGSAMSVEGAEIALSRLVLGAGLEP